MFHDLSFTAIILKIKIKKKIIQRSRFTWNLTSLCCSVDFILCFLSRWHFWKNSRKKYIFSVDKLQVKRTTDGYGWWCFNFFSVNVSRIQTQTNNVLVRLKPHTRTVLSTYEMFLYQEEMHHLLRTIFSCGLIHSSEQFLDNKGEEDLSDSLGDKFCCFEAQHEEKY